MHAKKTEVTIETWEGICDSLETLIKEGQMACEKRWSNVEALLTYLDFSILDPISQAPSPKLQLEQVERYFDDDNELIQQINILMMQEIKRWIKVPHALMAQIQVFMKEWKKNKKREISSQICKIEIHLRHAHFQDINEIKDLYAKWRSTLGQS